MARFDEKKGIVGKPFDWITPDNFKSKKAFYEYICMPQAKEVINKENEFNKLK